MERFFKRVKPTADTSQSSLPLEVPLEIPSDVPLEIPSEEGNDNNSNQNSINFILANLPADPGLRIPISNYNPNVRDQVRRQYLLKGPCQPRTHNFPSRKFGKSSRRFYPPWFDEYANWLEYSIAKDAAFCLCCYLFKPDIGDRAGSDTFVGEGFSNWKKKDRLTVHVGGPNSAHNQAWEKCEVLLKQKQHIDPVWSKQSDQFRSDYRVRLNAVVNCIRLLLTQGLAFRGNDESEDSHNQENFLAVLHFLANNNDEVKAVTFNNAPGNHKLTSPEIQKDIVNAAAAETVKVIICDIDDALFSILVDEARDISCKEQMSVVLRYVDRRGCVIERFVGVEHVASTFAISLKAKIDKVFSRHGLSISRLRGQGYDGASNMKGEYNGLKALILKKNASAFYVNCFAHQLQLALVGMAKKTMLITGLFCLITNVVNCVGGSSKRRDILRDKQLAKVVEAIDNGELSSGQDSNQENNLARHGATRWGSHYKTLISMITMFSSVIEVLEIVKDDPPNPEKQYDAFQLLVSLQSYEFIFCLNFIRIVLGITNELSQTLQKKDQEIVNAMNLVKVCKHQLQDMRNNGWDSLLEKVTSFCEKHEIDLCDLGARFLPPLKSRRKAAQAPIITNLHHYRCDLFYEVIDLQLMELDNRFTETNTELLLCMACLNPIDSFYAFDKEKLLRLARFYPNDFSEIELATLENQLDSYIVDVRSNIEFSSLKGISDLAQKMVDMRRYKVFPLVYLLITLALILPVATAIVERSFFAMNVLKTRLRNRMGDQWLNDTMVVYIERDIFDDIVNEVIMQRFQKMDRRRAQL